jgi:hypothetical protein
MSTFLVVLVAYYAGGITTLAVNELEGDGITFKEVLSMLVWPITAGAFVVDRINTYRKGV